MIVGGEQLNFDLSQCKSNSQLRFSGLSTADPTPVFLRDQKSEETTPVEVKSKHELNELKRIHSTYRSNLVGIRHSSITVTKTPSESQTPKMNNSDMEKPSKI